MIDLVSEIKVCKDCLFPFPISEFGKTGKGTRCCSCVKIYKKNWASLHPESTKLSAKKYQQAHLKEACSRTKAWQERNRIDLIIQRRIQRNGANILIRYPVDPLATEKTCTGCLEVKPLEEFNISRQRPDNRAPRCIQCSRDTYVLRASTVHGREQLRRWAREIAKRRRLDPKHNLDHRMGNALWYALRGAGLDKDGRSWETLVGYTAQDLVTHIESLFTAGMSWERLVLGEIHIDHKVPKSWFIYSSVDDEQFKVCWALSNLQPLWALDNLNKRDLYAD